MLLLENYTWNYVQDCHFNGQPKNGAYFRFIWLTNHKCLFSVSFLIWNKILHIWEKTWAEPNLCRSGDCAVLPLWNLCCYFFCWLGSQPRSVSPCLWKLLLRFYFYLDWFLGSAWLVKRWYSYIFKSWSEILSFVMVFGLPLFMLVIWSFDCLFKSKILEC